MSIHDTVRQFIRENFYIGNPDALADNASLLDHGIVDSTGILEVVAFLEKTFAIRVEDADMVPENLDTVAGIVAYVERKRRTN
jgi:acyl carrier protein